MANLRHMFVEVEADCAAGVKHNKTCGDVSKLLKMRRCN